MWLFAARCGAVWRDREAFTTEDTESTEGDRAMGLPYSRVGSFCISGGVARVGVVWQGLARFGTVWEVWARGIVFWDRELSGIFGKDDLRSQFSGESFLTPALSHGRLGLRARGYRWRPWEREWAVCAHHVSTSWRGGARP